jgi:hypothetical protein
MNTPSITFTKPRRIRASRGIFRPGSATGRPGRTQAGPAVTAGTITTVADGVGGPAKATTVTVSPCGARFAGGNLYIGDIAAIRQISPATGQLTTPVGTGSTTPLGDAGPATRASLNGSCTAALDPAGNLVVADIFDNRIRVVAVANGTFYGKPMTAGNIYSVAGNGAFGFSGDGGPATSAALPTPMRSRSTAPVTWWSPTRAQAGSGRSTAEAVGGRRPHPG